MKSLIKEVKNKKNVKNLINMQCNNSTLFKLAIKSLTTIKSKILNTTKRSLFSTKNINLDNDILNNVDATKLIKSDKKFDQIEIKPVFIVSDSLMPYGKTIVIEKNDELVKTIEFYKSFKNGKFCIFSLDKRRNLTSNIGILCEEISLNTDSIFLTSLKGDSRIYADTSSSFFQNLISSKLDLIPNQELPIGYSIVDDPVPGKMLNDVEISKNILNDVNRSIFAFYEITKKQNLDQSLLREINTAIITLQYLLKTNMDFIASLNKKSIQKKDDANTSDNDKKEQKEKDNDKNLYDLVSDLKKLSKSSENPKNVLNEKVESNKKKEFDVNSSIKSEEEKLPVLEEVNSLIFENIREFLRIAKALRKNFPIKESNEFLNSVDPIVRAKLLINFIYETGDFLIKDLHMLDEYKKDVLQKQEKYLLKFVKKQVEKFSGDSAESYNKRLEELYQNKDINEQTKRSIQLEIEMAFNTNANNENENEDNKKLSIVEDIFHFPWNKRQEVIFDVKYAADVLNTELFGLNKVKNRIDEYIAKLKRSYSMSNSSLTNKRKGFIILITGPPGTGKTTIAQLIGKALKRKTGIINLSGETDTINLKGSRRTYIDSQPSIFFKELVKLGVKNPVIILDEIDKIANKGDATSHSASSALLELLNPEENHNFIDQYLNVPLDFSETIFICTSNYNVNLLEPLLDRMEILEIDDYTFKEKKEISERYILPKLLNEYGLKNYEISKENPMKEDLDQIANMDVPTNSNEVKEDNEKSDEKNKNLSSPKIIFPENVIKNLIKDYSSHGTGCRGIKRSLEKLIRKINYDFYINPIMVNKKRFVVSNESLDTYLGIHKTADPNMLKLIKDEKMGYLYSDAYGNIGRLFIKPRIYSIGSNDDKNNGLNNLLKQSTQKDIYRNLEIYSKLSKPVKESINTAVNLSRKIICEMLSKDIPVNLENLIKAYCLYMTTPYQEKVGNSFGLVSLVALVANILDFSPIDDNILILGELNPNGKILKSYNLKFTLNSCEYYGINKIILPKGKNSLCF